MKFMHSLIGAFVIDTLNSEPENIEGKMHRKLEIKISEFFKRIFYLPCGPPNEDHHRGEFGINLTPPDQK